MASRFFTFSLILVFATCSFAHTVQTAEEPHKQMSEIFELLKEKDEDGKDE